ncbi:MAG: esterase/lipase family protein [Candidatus Hodarchaeales archaeon]|jgi:pimeloyl-ACP methyl ester carboxylesterase
MRVWIHGAFASHTSFNYLKGQMTCHNDLMINYDWNKDLVQVAKEIEDYIKIRTDGEEIDLIGHSLGGVFAAILAHSDLNVRSLITLSAPFGGIEVNMFIKWWFPFVIFEQMANLREHHDQLLGKRIDVPHVCFVSTKDGANPIFLGRPNDGVVSIESQRAMEHANYIDVDVNHYEILMSEDVIDVMRPMLKRK